MSRATSSDASLCVVASPELERVVARLVSDRAFRADFFADPARALRHAGIHLSAAERDALAASPLEVLDAFEEHIDPPTELPWRAVTTGHIQAPGLDRGPALGAAAAGADRRPAFS
jgi:putative modified peptide